MTATIWLNRYLALEDVEFTDPDTNRTHRLVANRGGFFSRRAVEHLVRAGKMKEVPEKRHPDGGWTLPWSHEREGPW
jgi:hypothetical protein